MRAFALPRLTAFQRQRRRGRAQAGFTLLEAIVALTIMAMCLLALYAWLATSTSAIRHVSAHAQALQDARTAVALMQTVNPMATPRGRRSLPELEVRWEAKPLSIRLFGMSEAYGATPFDFQLFDLDVSVLRGQRVVREFHMHKTGWVLARPIPLNDE